MTSRADLHLGTSRSRLVFAALSSIRLSASPHTILRFCFQRPGPPFPYKRDTRKIKPINNLSSAFTLVLKNSTRRAHLLVPYHLTCFDDASSESEGKTQESSLCDYGCRSRRRRVCIIQPGQQPGEGAITIKFCAIASAYCLVTWSGKKGTCNGWPSWVHLQLLDNAAVLDNSPEGFRGEESLVRPPERIGSK
ncbi:hypothetical protein K474DRAFT_1673645 [Panus rudis PR-1116 ss-1]|nr:hypothetical protein K474DRAFT_1673645 [Panus rudis PR-1116 ss-1]